MDKQSILSQVITRLSDELTTVSAAAKDAREYATDADSKAEDKYDTRALESSYLANGQARVAVEIAENLKAYRMLTLKSFAPGEPVALTALVEIERPGGNDFYFVGPRAGGLTVQDGGREVSVVTPQSPLGQRLLGQVAGGTVRMPSGRDARIVRVE